MRIYFICLDPKVLINPLSWRDDIVTVAVLGSVLAAILLISIVIFLWLNKNRHRHAERLQRRNSIRQSLHSVRSIGSSHGGFATIGAYKSKTATVSNTVTVKHFRLMLRNQKPVTWKPTFLSFLYCRMIKFFFIRRIFVLKVIVGLWRELKVLSCLTNFTFLKSNGKTYMYHFLDFSEQLFLTFVVFEKV